MKSAVVFGAVLVAIAGCGGDDDRSDGADVSLAWARPTPAGTTTSAVYMTMRADADDALIGVAVEPSIASMAMAHETATNDGQMSMDLLVDGVDLPAGDDVRFEPGGHHVMLEGLAQPLALGDAFELTLDFEHAESVVVEVAVQDEAP